MSLSSGLVRFAFPMLTLQPRDLHFADAFRIALQPGLASHRSSWPRRCFASQAVTATKAPTGEACIANGDPPQTQDIKRLQSFDYTAMLACISELQRLWVPARVEEAVQIRESMLALRLRTLNDSGWLYLSWHPAMAHIGLSLAKPQRGDVAEAFSFGEQAHNILKGLVLTQAVVPQLWERTAQLSFATRPGEEPAVTLHIEVMGRYSNAILSKAGGSVLAAGHQVGSKMSSARVVQVGRPYALPPAPPGIPPDACTSFADWQSSVLAAASTGNGASPATVSSCCIKGFLGVGPTLMRTLCVAAGIDPGAEAGSLSPADWEHLHAEWRAWLQYIGSGEFDAAPACTKYLTFGSRQRRQGQAMLEYVRDYYANFESEEEFGRVSEKSVPLLAWLNAGPARRSAVINNRPLCPLTLISRQSNEWKKA